MKSRSKSTWSLTRRALAVAALASMAVAAACGSESGPASDGADASADGTAPPSFGRSDATTPPFSFDAGFEEKSPPRECSVPPGFDD